MTPKTEHTTLILLLGGTGSRFESPTPKQFLKLPENNTPLFIQSLEAIREHVIIDHLILVVNKSYIKSNDFLEPLNAYRESIPKIRVDIVEGGNTRHESFKNGAARLISNESHALILHDANRPFISETFGRTIAEQVKLLSKEKACLVPVIFSADSLCKVSSMGKVVNYLSRDDTYRIQTPQLIYAPALEQAMTKSKKYPLVVDYTDEGSFMLSMGFDVYTFPGDPGNIKITTRDDVR